LFHDCRQYCPELFHDCMQYYLGLVHNGSIISD
jgi:hypothetical protein